MRRMSQWTLLLAVGIVAVGCAAPQSQELQQAEQAYSAAKDDPAVNENASVTLFEAKQALDRAKNADSLEEQKHFAYLAQRRIELAETQADQAQTREEVRDLQAQQEDFLNTLRRRQAEQARQQAEQAQQELQAYRTQEREQELTSAQQEAQQARQEMEQLREELQAAETRQTQAGTVLTLSDVVFEFDQAQLKSGAERSLGRLADFLQNHPERQVLVEGFTDAVGPEQYNRQLSRQRAEAVAQALQAQGISPDRITARGLGESYPVATNDSPVGRQQNRRVEITILNPGQQPEEAGRGNGRM